jgi:hypothetical protein
MSFEATSTTVSRWPTWGARQDSDENVRQLPTRPYWARMGLNRETTTVVLLIPNAEQGLSRSTDIATRSVEPAGC